MADKAKSPIWLLIVLIVLSLALAGSVFYLLQKERAKSLALQEELDDVKTRQRITENKLQEAQKLISSLELKLQEAKTQVDTLTTELQQEKTAKEEAKTLIEQLRVDLGQQKSLRSDLEKRFDQTQKSLQNLQAQVKILESKRAELETKIKDLEAQTQTQGVELGKIVVSPEISATAIQVPTKTLKEKPEKKGPVLSLEGKVLVINKDYNFAVINLGSKDGVGIGDVFSIYHNNKYVGDVKVEKVHDSMSAAGFVSADIKDKVSEGDKIVRKTK